VFVNWQRFLHGKEQPSLDFPATGVRHQFHCRAVLSACFHPLKEMRYAGEFGSAGSTQ